MKNQLDCQSALRYNPTHKEEHAMLTIHKKVKPLAHGYGGTALYVTRETHNRLKELRKASGVSMSKIVSLLVNQAEIEGPKVRAR
jgi:hypothetical protein